MILFDATIPGWLLAAALCGAALPSLAQDTPDHNTPATRVARIRSTRQRSKPTFAHAVPTRTKRRRTGNRSSTSGAARNAKRRSNDAITLNDYVLTQPPIYTGPPRPPGYVPPRRDPEPPVLPIPGIADFLAAAAAHYSFVPDRPKTESNSSRPTPGSRRPPASPRIRRSASMPSRPAATAPMTDRPASSATARTRGRSRRPMGYNQLLSTNTVSLLAEHGDKFVAALKASAERARADRSARRSITRSRRCRR